MFKGSHDTLWHSVTNFCMSSEKDYIWLNNFFISVFAYCVVRTKSTLFASGGGLFSWCSEICLLTLLINSRTVSSSICRKVKGVRDGYAKRMIGGTNKVTIEGSRISQTGGASIRECGENPLFGKIFAEYCMKMKEIGPGCPLDPPMRSIQISRLKNLLVNPKKILLIIEIVFIRIKLII